MSEAFAAPRLYRQSYLLKLRSIDHFRIISTGIGHYGGGRYGGGHYVTTAEDGTARDATSEPQPAVASLVM